MSAHQPSLVVCKIQKKTRFHKAFKEGQFDVVQLRINLNAQDVNGIILHTFIATESIRRSERTGVVPIQT